MQISLFFYMRIVVNGIMHTVEGFCMKKFIPLFLSALLAFSCTNVSLLYAEGDEDNGEETTEESEDNLIESNSFRILFTSDLQDHVLSSKVVDGEETKEVGGYARLASLINMNRTDDTVVIDGGNFSTGTSFSALNSTSAPDLTLLSTIGYDAIALGDEEFTFGTQSLSDMINASENTTTLLTGNLSFGDSDSSKSLKNALSTRGAASYKIVEKNGVKIGLFSLINEEKEISSDVSLADAVDTAKDIVSSLQEEGADYIVAIAHGGNDFAHEIAKKVDGINTIIASCDTEASNEIEKENDVNIVSSGKNGQYLGVLDIQKDSYSIDGYQLVEITTDIEENEDIRNRINDYKNNVNSQIFDSYGLSIDDSLASNPYDFTEIDHSSTELLNNNTADLVTDAYAYAYDDWYTEWYEAWKDKKKQMLKAAQSLLENETSEEESTEEQSTEEQTEENQEEATATPEATATAESEASKRIEEIQNMKPTVKKRAIGLISQKEIQGTFTKDSISTQDVYNVVPNGMGSDGSSGESLILVFLKGSDIRKLCEYDATVTRNNDLEDQLFFSGLKYTYSDYRQDYNHVEDVYVDAVNDYYTPISNDDLYPVVTTLTLAKDLLNLSSKTDGNYQIQYYDENGGKILSLSTNVLTYKNKELKSFKAIASYISEMSRNSEGKAEITSSYNSANENKQKDTEFTFTGFFKNTSHIQLVKYFEYLLGFITLIIGIKLISYIINNRREKKENNKENNDE